MHHIITESDFLQHVRIYLAIRVGYQGDSYSASFRHAHSPLVLFKFDIHEQSRRTRIDKSPIVLHFGYGLAKRV